VQILESGSLEVPQALAERLPLRQTAMIACPCTSPVRTAWPSTCQGNVPGLGDVPSAHSDGLAHVQHQGVFVIEQQHRFLRADLLARERRPNNAAASAA